MTELRLDSRSIDPVQRRAYEAIVRVASRNRVPFIIVGASARDLVMHYGYGARIQRATRDIDLAVQVEDWQAFRAIKTSLVNEGYKETEVAHRLLGERGVPLDIIPFGSLEEPDSKIVWPPDGAFEMGVMGFEEALHTADRIIIEGEPALELSVASPEGLALLKLVAWSERDPHVKQKDAADFVYILGHYEDIPAIESQLYAEHADLLELYDWDTRLSGAHLLGQTIVAIAQPKTLAFLRHLLDEECAEKLSRDAGPAPTGVNEAVIGAFRNGLYASHRS